jgi:hypothetical protein
MLSRRAASKTAAIRVNTTARYLVLLVFYLLDEPKIDVAIHKLVDSLIVQAVPPDTSGSEETDAIVV